MARLKAIESRFGFRYGGLLATEGLGMKVFLGFFGPRMPEDPRERKKSGRLRPEHMPAGAGRIVSS
jgi:hypothetical protein